MPLSKIMSFGSPILMDASERNSSYESLLLFVIGNSYSSSSILPIGTSQSTSFQSTSINFPFKLLLCSYTAPMLFININRPMLLKRSLTTCASFRLLLQATDSSMSLDAKCRMT